MEFTRASQLATGMLSHSFKTVWQSWWIFEMLCFSTFSLRMCQRCSIGFRSGDMLVHSITTTLCLFRKAAVILEVCFGSLSCWNTALQLSVWREGIIFCSSISQYMVEFMLPSMKCNSPTPNALMQPQTMSFSPPCLTVGMVQTSWYSSPGYHHTCLTPSEPNKLILVSSDQSTFFQKVMPFVDIFAENWYRFLLCRVFRRGSFLGRQLCRPILWRVRRMVWELTGWYTKSLLSALMSTALLRLSFVDRIWMWRSAHSLSFLGHPARGMFWVDPVFLKRCRILHSVAAQLQDPGYFPIAFAINMECDNSFFNILRELQATRYHLWTFSDEYERVGELYDKLNKPALYLHLRFS